MRMRAGVANKSLRNIAFMYLFFFTLSSLSYFGYSSHTNFLQSLLFLNRTAVVMITGCVMSPVAVTGSL